MKRVLATRKRAKKGAEGKEIFAPEPFPPTARQRGAKQKIALSFFDFARAGFFFSFKNKAIFLRGRRRFPSAPRLRRVGVAAGGGSAEISLLGFMYQIWQNNFKGLSGI